MRKHGKNSCRSSTRVEGSRNRAATNSGHTLCVYRNTVVNPSVFSTWFVSVNTNTRQTMFAASIAIIKISHAPPSRGLFSTIIARVWIINVAKEKLVEKFNLVNFFTKQNCIFTYNNNTQNFLEFFSYQIDSNLSEKRGS